MTTLPAPTGLPYQAPPSDTVYPTPMQAAPLQPAPPVSPTSFSVASPAVSSGTSNGALVAVAWVLAFVSFGYMIPWAVAVSRNRRDHVTVLVVNFLLGWTFIGWIVALVMACQSDHVTAAPTTTIMVTQNVGHGPVAVSAAQPLAAAGWYPSPTMPGMEYWDGMRWTGHRA